MYIVIKYYRSNKEDFSIEEFYDKDSLIEYVSEKLLVGHPKDSMDIYEVDELIVSKFDIIQKQPSVTLLLDF